MLCVFTTVDLIPNRQKISRAKREQIIDNFGSGKTEKGIRFGSNGSHSYQSNVFECALRAASFVPETHENTNDACHPDVFRNVFREFQTIFSIQQYITLRRTDVVSSCTLHYSTLSTRSYTPTSSDTIGV